MKLTIGGGLFYEAQIEHHAECTFCWTKNVTVLSFPDPEAFGRERMCLTCAQSIVKAIKAAEKEAAVKESLDDKQDKQTDG